MKKLFTLAMAASFLFSCSGGDSSDPEPVVPSKPTPEKWAINIATNIARATDTSFENGDKVGIYVVNTPNALKSSGNHADNIGYSYSGSWSTSTPIYWKDETAKADFYCYYPYTSAISNVESYSFSVKADQSNETNYKASDFLWGKTANVTPTKSAVNITVSHIMSNIIIKLIDGDGYTSQDLESASVTICNLKTSSTINLSTGIATATGTATDITPQKVEGQYRALVIPQSITEADLVQVTIDDQVYTLKKSVTFEAGKQHTLTLTVEHTNQGINIGINGWESASDDFGGTVE